MAQHDYVELEQALSTFVVPGQVFEIRLTHNGRKRIDAGYFDQVHAAATAIASLNEPYQGIYFVPNPLVPDLLARSANRIAPWSQFTTSDTDVTERRWLLIDIDPVRPSGISATDPERDNAVKIARRIAGALSMSGWPEPVINTSGNGAHLMYRMREPNNEYVRDEIAKFLRCLNAVFKDLNCEVDRTTFNAARIWRVPGTWARKGDNIATRPHRKAAILSHPPEGQRLVTLVDIHDFNEKYGHLLNEPVKAGTGASKNRVEYPEDERRYKGLNEQAMNRLQEWVPVFFPEAREYKKGYRVASADLGLGFEEDLTIHPWPLGIKYFGVADQGDKTEGRRTPISLLAELKFLGEKTLAAHKLADALKAPLNEFSNLEPVQNTAGSSATNLPGIEPNRPVFDFSRVPSIADLQKREFKKQTWIIPGVLPTGNIMLTARPKMRKTFLALQLCQAICTGDKFLNWTCEQGEALMLALEDNERRLRERIRLLNTFRMKAPDLSGFRYWTGGVDISPTTGKTFVSNPEEAEKTFQTFPRGQAGVDALEKYLETFPKTKIIVIDTLAHFREQSNNRDVYQRDYDQMMPITRLAARKNVLIMPVHHEKKGLASQESGDFMEDVSGSSGLTGGVDGVMSIKGRRGVQEENEARKLLLSGRDIPRDFDIDMAFDAERGGWLTAVRQDAAAAIKELLTRHPFVNQQEFASLLPSISRGRISQVLTTLKYDGIITQSKYGYSLVRNP